MAIHLELHDRICIVRCTSKRSSFLADKRGANFDDDSNVMRTTQVSFSDGLCAKRVDSVRGMEGTRRASHHLWGMMAAVPPMLRSMLASLNCRKSVSLILRGI